MSALFVELFHDDDTDNWHYRVPALGINGGGSATREEAERACRAAIAFALLGHDHDRDIATEGFTPEVSIGLDPGITPQRAEEIISEIRASRDAR